MKKAIPYIIIAILLAVIVFCLFGKKGQTEVVERRFIDTVVVIRVDTVHAEPVLISERVVDTVYVESASGGSAALPITQRFYSSDEYQAWVSGYKPRLDSINVFRKVVTNTVHETTVREIYPKHFDLFVTAGGMAAKGDFAPNIGLTMKFKNDVLLGGTVGYYGGNAYYSLSLGYKLNRR